MSELKLSEVLRIEEPNSYKVHLASWNGANHPLDVFVRDRSEWQGWNEWGNNIYDSLIVSEILPDSYSGECFPGYDKVEIGFAMLENLVGRQRLDWKAALENAKGVYLIGDTRTGKKYIGSAYGTTGIWSRWTRYVKSVHGQNDELVWVIKKEGIEYARKYFTFSVLEYFPMKSDERLVFEREAYWKRVLMTRQPFGYNVSVRLTASRRERSYRG